MTTRTEQEIRRSAPARGAGTPKSGAGRSGTAAKPVPPPRPAASTLDHADEARDERTGQARPRQGAEPRDGRTTTRARRGPTGRARRPEDTDDHTPARGTTTRQAEDGVDERSGGMRSRQGEARVTTRGADQDGRVSARRADGEERVTSRRADGGERVSARRAEDVVDERASGLRTRQGDELRDGRSAGSPEAEGEPRVASRTRGGRSVRPQGTRRPASARRGPARRQRGPFIVLVLGLLGGGLVSLLLLNTVLAQDSIRAGNLKSEIAQLELGNQQLGVDNERRKQPAEIAEAGKRQNLEPDWKDPNVITPASEDSSKVGGANR
ncbi:hypothetical protein [Nonomuraea endophytica]|uniref:Cell division protein FtsL n=1 Tax=Nonomuraea endophytica TaxID=714136 RepID=A0A7W8A080_9ACTN|nr:hypothetical protein [Nonomuraea endophytica]MBB5077101.1 hypothetical protein [Nonomuraea endophytica]